MNHEQAEYLKSIYFDPLLPGSYSGVDKLYRTVKNEGLHPISKGKIKKWLSKQRVYTAHKPVRRHFKRRRVIVDVKHAQWDADTVSMTRYVKVNNGFTYILIAIDILSRYLWTVPLKTLKGKEMVTALKSVFQVTKPRKLRTDKGSEFFNKDVKTYLRNQNVGYFTTTNETKANFSERVIRTIKSKLTKYMDSKQTHKWIDVLQKVTDSYNNSYHRSIKMSPKNALQTDDPTLWKIQYGLKPKKIKVERKHPPKIKNPFHFKVGERVKLSHLRGAFEKDYDEKWTGEIFSITHKYEKQGFPIYDIKSWNNKLIEGTFYESEIQRVVVDENELYNIEQVIKSRKRGGKTEVLVKWQGWGKEYNSWVDKNEVEDI